MSGDCKSLIILLVIRINDLGNLIELYPGFKSDCCETKESYLTAVTHLSTNAAGRFDAVFNELNSCQDELCHQLAKACILPHKVQMGNMLYLFTIEKAIKKKEDITAAQAADKEKGKGESSKKKAAALDAAHIGSRRNKRGAADNENNEEGSVYLMTILDFLNGSAREIKTMLAHEDGVFDENVYCKILSYMFEKSVEAYIQRLVMLIIQQ